MRKTNNYFYKGDKIMSKVYSTDELEKQRKKAQRREWFYKKENDVRNWYYNNKEAILVLVPIGVGAITTLTKVVGKNANLKKEQKLKDLYCYDRSLGHYWALRRELSNSEWVEIDKRKAKGERLADILSEFKVLK